MRGIRLHKEFGLNPTISQCILCGKPKNEIALLGASYKGQAPMNMVTSVEPCEKCRKKFLSQGVLMVGATQEPYGYSGKTKTIPTGKLAVLKDKAFQKMFNVPIPKGKIAFTEDAVLNKLFEMTGKIPKGVR